MLTPMPTATEIVISSTLKQDGTLHVVKTENSGLSYPFKPGTKVPGLVWKEIYKAVNGSIVLKSLIGTKPEETQPVEVAVAVTTDDIPEVPSETVNTTYQSRKKKFKKSNSKKEVDIDEEVSNETFADTQTEES